VCLAAHSLFLISLLKRNKENIFFLLPNNSFFHFFFLTKINLIDWIAKKWSFNLIYEISKESLEKKSAKKLNLSLIYDQTFILKRQPRMTCLVYGIAHICLVKLVFFFVFF